MAIQKITYETKLPIFVLPCQEVAVCLGEGWEDQTVSGLTIVYATVGNNIRYLGSGGTPLVPIMQNFREVGIMQIELSFDDDQFLDDDETDLPFVITCEDIQCIDPCACMIRSLIAGIVAAGT